ncbi:hypothetical protein [Mesorhizobium sp. CN2-181]|uniref:hypothetical protein n=1 Tax=Mesorhizobium yinganensis TaxID=3157707 RepID=UPI0032B85244
MAALRSAAAVSLAAVVLYAMQRTTPGYSDITAPIVISGPQGAKVQADAFAFDVKSIRTARQLRAESFGKTQTFSSSGVWIVVEAEAEATSESLGLTAAEWQAADGIRYALTQRLPATIGGFLPAEMLEPGLPRPVLLAFEAPGTALDGGTLIVARSKLQPLDDEIHVAVEPIGPGRIKPEITIRRNEEGRPWTLLP